MAQRLDDYQVSKMGNITRCKDQSHAIDWGDRLISKKYGGKVKYDKTGKPMSPYVVAKKRDF